MAERHIRRGRESGMATAEFAAALPALLLVVTMVLGGLRVGLDQVQCVDAARVGVRLVARGESAEVVRTATRRAAPAGAAITVDRRGGEVSVTVAAPQRALLGAVGAGWGPEATATALRESARGGAS